MLMENISNIYIDDKKKYHWHMYYCGWKYGELLKNFYTIFYIILISIEI
jgi:hypothetical protein